MNLQVVWPGLRLKRSDKGVCGLCMCHCSEVQLGRLVREESVIFDAGEGVSNNIVHTTNVPNGGSKLGNIVELTSLSG